MNILLLQLDGKLPNLALMRLASHLRQQNHTVTLRDIQEDGSVERGIWDNFDQVYASTIFEKTRPTVRRLLEVYPDAVVGGTGWDMARTLEGIGVHPEQKPDYADYPEYPHSLGFTQRGCRLSCEFCVVPRKEGKVKEVSTVWDIWRGDPYPRHLCLLDNDFFGQPHWRERIGEIREGKFKVSFNQGINARLLPDEGAEAIASVDYRDGNFKTKRIYTAWDNRKDESVLFRGLGRLVKYGVKPDHIMVYMLIGYWPGETEEDWLYRQQRLRDFGARPYPMPYNRSNTLSVGFQRWIVGAYDKRIPWSEWKTAHCEPRNLSMSGRVSLSLFGESS